MNKEKFLQYMFNQFPSTFENSFSRDMLSNLLNVAENVGNESQQIVFLMKVIPEVTKQEIVENLFL